MWGTSQRSQLYFPALGENQQEMIRSFAGKVHNRVQKWPGGRKRREGSLDFQVEKSIRHQPGRIEGAVAGGSGRLSSPLGVKCCQSVSASLEKEGIKRKKEKEGI